MSTLIANISKIFFMNGTILLIPGVNFLLIARYALLDGFKAGFQCVAGITLAIMLHVIFSALSMNIILKTSPWIFSFIRYGGAVYLIYLGTRFLKMAWDHQKFDPVSKKISTDTPFKSGFLVDFLNPFISIFYLSLFAIITPQETNYFEWGCYGLTILLLTFSWFTCVAVLFSRGALQKKFQKISHYIQGLAGVAMYYFSSKIIFGF